jgi:hypothetical protein
MKTFIFPKKANENDAKEHGLDSHLVHDLGTAFLKVGSRQYMK